MTNCIIESGVWPEPWKHATVTPVLKPGKPPLEVSSYRPVSILCALSKVVEKVLQDQLSVVAESKILPQEQHGFRPGRNTETALATLLSAADQAKRNNKKAALVTFDFSSAFDTIDSRTLKRRMKPWATREAISLLINYLSDGTQEVNWNGTRSLTREVKYGVRQGSILGPLLFTIVTATLPTAVLSENQTLCAYADDTSALVCGDSWEEVKEKVTGLRRELQTFSVNSYLQLNEDKTQVMPIGRGCPQVFPDAPGSVTLLGLTIDSSLRFCSSHKEVIALVKARIGVIWRLQAHLPRGQLLRQIANALVVSRISYAAWLTVEACLPGKEPRSTPHPFQSLLNGLARALLGVRLSDRLRSSDLLDRSGLPSLNQLVIRAAAMAAWKACRGGPLSHLLLSHSARSRGASNNLRSAADNSICARNMALCWNACEDLRRANTHHSAKVAARKLGVTYRRL